MALSPIQALQVAQSTPRVNRRPRHNFNLKHSAFQIQPFLLAPVVPGETLKNLLMQSRVVTDPLKNGLIGWWIEYYIFYVKHRDLAAGADAIDTTKLQAMMLDPEFDTSVLKTANVRPWHYKGAGTTIDWVRPLMISVVNEFFRDEGEDWDDFIINNLPAARIQNNGLLDSAIDATLVDVGADPALSPDMQDLDMKLQMYEFLRAQGMANMSYEDYLKSFGVRQNRVEVNKPELLRYIRDWQYPSNTVNPSTGVPSAAVSWAVQERADKDRFFTEPGFIFGVTVARPKVHLGQQTTAGAALLDNAMAWLPAMLRDEVYTSLKEVDKVNGIFAGQTNNYWLDLRDLFIHGDQFVNFDPTTDVANNTVELPTAAMQKKYPTAADATAMFAAPAANTIRQDGVVTLTIAGSQRDHT